MLIYDFALSHSPSLVIKGFTKSLAMTVLSEIGDKTFFAAAVRIRVLFFVLKLIDLKLDF